MSQLDVLAFIECGELAFLGFIIGYITLILVTDTVFRTIWKNVRGRQATLYWLRTVNESLIVLYSNKIKWRTPSTSLAFQKKNKTRNTAA